MRTVADLRTGDDACFIYGQETEWAEVVASYVRAGLQERQRVLYVHDCRSPERVGDELRREGVDVEQAEVGGQILFLPARQLFCRGAGYSFERVLDQLHAFTAMALADGWSALRVTTEMSWILRQTQGPDRLLPQEARMVAFFRDSAALGLSQFDRAAFSPAALMDALLAFPLAVIGGEAVHNFYYTPDLDGTGGWRSQATLERWLSNLKERKRVSENLRDILQLQREVLDNVGSGIIVTDRLGRIVQCNSFVERFAGMPTVEIQGRHVREFLPDVSVDRFDETFARVLQGEVVLSPDLNVRRPGGGASLWALATLAPYRNSDGQIIGAIVAVSDITSRKAVEAAMRANDERLRQAQKLEAVGRLAGGVAHDMNNALNAIIAFADLALQAAGSDGGLQADIGEIRAAAGRAAGVTARLLAFSRRQVLQPQVVEINAIVSKVEATVRRLLGEGVAFFLRLNAEAGWVRSDPAQIEQVIINLAVNAQEAMLGGGRLTIETDRVRVEKDQTWAADTILAGDYAVIRISDSGSGMPSEVLEHAFEPFFTTKGIGRGSGLGLPVVYGIVKQSGGHIRIHSEPGRGTLFEVFLAHTSEPDVALGLPATPAGNTTVLLVEDEDAVRKVVARVLDRAGYRVLLAANASEALALYEQATVPIAALVSDVVMPGMGGKQLADALATRCPSLKVLLMTGYTDDEILRRGDVDEGRAMIVKPFSPRDLLHSLREVLQT